jgi:hypothetical protein
MLRKWSHGHSLFTGAFVGLFLASYRVWLLMAFVFILGAAAALFVVNTRKVLRWLTSSTSPLSMRQWKSLRRRVNDLRPDDEIGF